MKFTQAPTLRVEDYKDQASWIGKLFSSLNPFIQALNQIFNAQISFGDNILSVSQSYSIQTFQAFSLKWGNATPPVDVRIVKASSGAQQTPTCLLPVWSYDSSTQQISISQILEVRSSGVSAINGVYQFTVRATV